ncbi:MAG: hypothetical protein KF887_10315 [Paracoccaceae bacterium]|nr:MAG: hypothetical protein KF887_10315 [Paracoccaceae bacterium]
MMPLRFLLLALLLSGPVAGCARIAALLPGDRAADAPAGADAPAADAPPAESPRPPAPPPGARTAAALDTTSAADKAAALAAPAAPASERELGRVAVSLGNPAEPGFWLRSALVTAAGPGRVVTEGGASLAVDLLPGEGAAQLSLPAFRALDLPLTALPMVTILAR